VGLGAALAGLCAAKIGPGAGTPLPPRAPPLPGRPPPQLAEAGGQAWPVFQCRGRPGGGAGFWRRTPVARGNTRL